MYFSIDAGFISKILISTLSEIIVRFLNIVFEVWLKTQLKKYFR